MFDKNANLCSKKVAFFLDKHLFEWYDIPIQNRRSFFVTKELQGVNTDEKINDYDGTCCFDSV
ncbi:hypothetical protein K170097C1_24450 [Hungatella effluvii]